MGRTMILSCDMTRSFSSAESQMTLMAPALSPDTQRSTGQGQSHMTLRAVQLSWVIIIVYILCESKHSGIPRGGGAIPEN